MTKFEGCYLTAAGLALSAKQGIDLVFTRAETGSGMISSPDEVRNLTQLKHKEYDCQLEDIQIKGETAEVIFYVTNKGVTAEYKLTEIGVYANDETGAEILYCVVFAYKENAETIEQEVAGQITYCQRFCVQTKVSADANVSVQIGGTEHEWMVNYFKKYAGEVRIEDGTLQEQIDNHSHDVMTGATKDKDGKAGMVPAPKAGQQDMVLYGDGTYRKGGGYIVFPEFTMDFSTGHLSAIGGAGVNFSINSAGHLESEVL